MNPHGLRAALVIGLAAALSSAIAGGLGLGGQSTTFAVVIAAVVVRPDFGRWPLALYPVLIVLMGLCMGFGTLTAQLLAGMPEVVLFALVTVVLRIAALLLPGKLQMLANVVTLGGAAPVELRPQLEGLGPGIGRHRPGPGGGHPGPDQPGPRDQQGSNS